MDRVHKLRIGVVGGGIGGLAFAVALTHLNLVNRIQIDIYEAAAKLTQVGAGITLWPRGWEIIRILGLEDGLAKHVSPPQEIVRDGNARIGFIYKKSDHPENVSICNLLFRGGSLSFHRADVQQVFLANISPSIQVHLNKRLTSYSENDNEVRMFFKDGATAACDLLIGADGINSVVRRGFIAKMYNLSEVEAAREARPLWTGTMVYRSLIDSKVIKRQNPTHPCLTHPLVYCGKSKASSIFALKIVTDKMRKHIVSYPISSGKLINAVGFVSEPDKEGTFLEGPAVISSTTDVVSSFFTKWSDEARCIIDNMHNPSRWAIETVKPLDKYGSSRIAMLGDAAHAMPVHLGNGAGQALEDGYILAHLLLKSFNQGHFDVPKIVDIYSRVRQPFANFVAKASVDQGRNYEFTTPDFDEVREGDILPEETLLRLGEKIVNNWKWTWDSSVRTDLNKALSLLPPHHYL